MTVRSSPGSPRRREPYDVIVVGARCAGSPTAMLLAREGLRVLLLDRASFPSDVVSSHLVHDGGAGCLERWGLLAAVRAIPVPAMSKDTFDFGLFSLSGSPATVDGRPGPGTIAPPRIRLDALLLAAAEQAGAEVRQDCRVTELLVEDGRVAGVRYRTSAGTVGAERAGLVVGADGRHSLVARQVGAETYEAAPSLTCASYAYWTGLDVDQLEASFTPDRFVTAFPTVDSLTCVYVAFPHDEQAVVRTDRGESYRRALREAPAFRDRVGSAEQVTPCRGSADLGTYYRRTWGPGWVLVGDSRHYQDPILAQGIGNAFRDAEAVARAITTGLDGGSLRPELEAYERARTQETEPVYRFGQEVGAFRPTPRLARLMLALQDDQDATEAFIGALAGTIPADAFFSAENTESIIAGALGSGETR
ncbi:MAG: NAD(P)/FAD-dependent oxidoreductase [Acidimicrobiales bacterium]